MSITSAAFSPTPLKEEEKAKYWFLTAVNDTSKSYPRMRILPNQWVSDYEDDTLFIK